ncbi:MAG: decarboxylating 6-phosphogluconate dehydrogenase [Sphingobacteriaceae bacterium]|nr:decarboxylating 6-phosphogluconate dehydrogenase [Cytophagaceae bacterium]
MQLGLIGLGKMGYNLALNFKDHGHQVVVNDVNRTQVDELATEGFAPAYDLDELCQKLSPQRVIWLMVPAGKITASVIGLLEGKLSPGDVIIDGGNSHFRDSQGHYAKLKEKGIHFLDCGTSGGMDGARNGACTMIGGDREAYEVVAQALRDVCVPDGSLYTGASGSGHFTKMVHNGIEYGMMQAIAEGFEVLDKSQFDYDFKAVAKLWNNGSVVRSWLMELMEEAFSKDPRLDTIKGVMHSSGEGKWTLETALDLGVPTPVIALSLLMRYRSLQDDTFSGKVVAALRNEFGGHAVEKK